MIKNAFALFILSIFLLNISSCGSENKEENSSPVVAQFDLIKTDSIRIDKLETIQITDYDRENKQLLAFATSTKQCLELDMEGNILSEVDLTGEGPGHFGRAITELGYFNEGKIIHGPAIYYTYNKDFSYKGRIEYEGGTAVSLLGPIYGAPIVIHKNGGQDQLVRVIDHNVYGNLQLKPGHFDKAMMIDLLGEGDEDKQSLLQYPENSIYRTSELFYASHQPVVSYNSENNLLMLMLPLEQKLYTYDATRNFELLETIPLDLKSFNSEPRGLPYEDQHKNSLSGFGRANELNYVYNQSNSLILSLQTKGDLTIVVHKTGFSDNSITSYNESLKKAQTDSKIITTFFKAGKKVYETEERFKRMVLLSNRQFIVPNINDEIERDYNLYDTYAIGEKIRNQY